MKRIELHTDTLYSEELSFLSPRELIRACVDSGCVAVAITDRNSTAAFLEAEQEAQRLGIRLIYGLTLDCVDRDDRYAVTVLAKDQDGLTQLFQLLTMETSNQFSFGQCITRRQLEEHRSHLLVGSCAKDGQIVRAILHGAPTDAVEDATSGYDYLELPLEPYEVSAELIRLSRRLSIPLCAVQQARLTPRADAVMIHAYRAAALYRKQALVGNQLMNLEELECAFTELYVLPDERLAVQQALQQGPEQLAAQIQPVLPLAEWPWNQATPSPTQAMEELRLRAKEALSHRFPQDCPQSAARRTEEELAWVEAADAAQTILLLADAAHFLRQSQVPFLLAGRYNASYLLYLLDVTNVDPLVCGLAPEFLWTKMRKVRRMELHFPTGWYDALSRHLKRRYEDLVEHQVLASEVPLKSQALEAGAQYVARHPDEPELNGLLEDQHFLFCLGMGTSPKSLSRAHQLCLTPKTLQEKLPILPGDDNQLPRSLLGSWRLGWTATLLCLDSPLLTALSAFQRRTGVPCCQVPLDDSQVYLALTDCLTQGNGTEQRDEILTVCRIAGLHSPEVYDEILQWLELSDLPSLSRIISLSHSAGLWEATQPLLNQHAICPADVITCREDVYRYLTSKGASKDWAGQFSELVRNGKFHLNRLTPEDAKNLDACGAEAWFRQICDRTYYFWPESHSAAHAVHLVHLIWYILHFPDLTKPILSDSFKDI